MRHLLRLLPLLITLLSAPLCAAEADDEEWAKWPEEEAQAPAFDDAPLAEEVHLPSWFRLSFLNLREDLKDAVAHERRGLVVYFGQKFCPYCQALMEVNFGKPDIAKYTRRHFDVIAIDIFGDRQVTDMAGQVMSEKAFAEQEDTRFTPSLLFYDADGKEALRLRGYYPPYQFRAALEYVADGHYQRESFRSYLERADPTFAFEAGGLNVADFFSPPPYALDRSHFAAQRPLIVFFEQGDCHACDVLHSGPLAHPDLLRTLAQFDTVQLDMWADTPVVTPTGQRTTARGWAEQLGLFYAPTLIFFDGDGHEVMRVDSVVKLLRLKNVLDYIISGAYRAQPFQRWRRSQGEAQP